MAITLKITDGTTTIDLTGSGYQVQAYEMTHSTDAEAVQEAVTVAIFGGLSTVRSAIYDLGQLANQARRWAKSQIRPPVYVQYKATGADDLYRSELLNFDVVPNSVNDFVYTSSGSYIFDLVFTRRNYWEDTVNASGATGQYAYTPAASPAGNAIYNSWIETTVTDGVLASGDGATLIFSGTLSNNPLNQALALSLKYTIAGVVYTATGNIYTSDKTAFAASTGLSVNPALTYVTPSTGAWRLEFTTAPDNATNITLTYQYGYRNHLTILAAETEGDLGDMPYPLEYWVRNDKASVDLNHVFTGSIHGYGYDAILQYEAESYLGGLSGSAVADATCSGGNRADLALSNDNETALVSIDITSAQATKLAGRWFMPILRFTSAVNTADIPDIYFRAATLDATGSYYYARGEQVRPIETWIIQPLQPIQLPPWNYTGGSFNSAGFKLNIYAQRATGSTETASLDFVYLMPLDGYNERHAVGVGAPTNSYMLIQPMENTSAVYDVGTGVGSNIYESRFGQVMIYPGEDNRVCFLAHDFDTYNAPKDWRLIISDYLKVRRRSI